MNADENKERTASEEREEVRLSGRGGERTKGRATSGAMSAAVSAASGAARRAAGSLFRLTPSGDAARMWLPMAISFVVLVVAFFAAGGSVRPVHWLLAADAFYGLFLVLTWGAMWHSTPAHVQRWALAQERPRSRWRRFAEVITDRRVFSGGAGMFVIISFSVAGVFLALGLLPRGGDLGAQPLQTLLSVLGVMLSWALLHTSYAMYYAHLYYRIPHQPGGMEFPGVEEPAPLDFAYFAFTVGTAFSTSDVSVSSPKVRRTVLFHSVLAFFYYATIFALVVNLVIGSV